MEFWRDGVQLQISLMRRLIGIRYRTNRRHLMIIKISVGMWIYHIRGSIRLFRYYNVGCFDWNRIVLKDRSPHNDFYHANSAYLKGDEQFHVIAAQVVSIRSILHFNFILRVLSIIQQMSSGNWSTRRKYPQSFSYAISPKVFLILPWIYGNMRRSGTDSLFRILAKEEQTNIRRLYRISRNGRSYRWKCTWCAIENFHCDKGRRIWVSLSTKGLVINNYLKIAHGQSHLLQEMARLQCSSNSDSIDHNCSMVGGKWRNEKRITHTCSLFGWNRKDWNIDRWDFRLNCR